MAKHKQKKAAKKHPNKIWQTIKSHKLIVFLSFLVLLFPASYVYEKYKDWDNAQMIKGLAEDFPALVSEIEQATGLELEQKTDCSITTEKFGGGVRTCEISTAKATEKINVEKAIEAVSSSYLVSDMSLTDNKRAYKIKYMNKNSCSISNRETIYLTCITAVREANIELAREVFLNQ